MRRAATIPCCLAFVTAFVFAPFQHVHHEGGHDHDHAPLVHSHLSPHHHDHGAPHIDVPGQSEIENADDDDQPVSLDTFTLVLTPHFAPFLPMRMPVLVPPPIETRLSADAVEERGNGPPLLRQSPPRAPPA